jgi:hypothetical protein
MANPAQPLVLRRATGSLKVCKDAAVLGRHLGGCHAAKRHRRSFGVAMISSHVLGWTLTASFALTGVHYLARCVRPTGGGGRPLVGRLTGLTHLLMSLVMVAMLWSWRLGVWRGVSIVVFAAAACWFGVRASVAGAGRVPAGGRLELVQHAAMMGVMVWMILLVPANMASSAGLGAHSMPGMGMSTAGMLSAGGPTVANAVVGTYFLVATLWWIGRGLRQSWATASPAASPMVLETGCGGSVVVPARAWLRTNGLAVASHAVMSAGTGVMLLAMG